MRILFDRCTPETLKQFLSVHQVQTTERLGWNRLKNGALIKAAETAGFDLMVTTDQNIRYQQNLSERKIALVVLGSNRWPRVKLHVEKIVAAVDAAQPNSYAFIEIPLTPKPEYRPSFQEFRDQAERDKSKDPGRNR